MVRHEHLDRGLRASNQEWVCEKCGIVLYTNKDITFHSKMCKEVKGKLVKAKPRGTWTSPATGKTYELP
jgi:hypothetical protein